ncbi:short transient receptor potential channel 4-like isoform X2 [Anneissia japonica]|uniref:short transient receptor potential channel 4-like isoform X1 n=1 Tax=Anneissia japonica TaxID=1529436 RepID=UPI0014256DEB|nr:short transient receptor potential channel 4-like isoform X1 [Anneissia japonica]XP_033099109.1 short transient receptor potential channel 4-like isoform X1 [Anneissia japonica]XP_033099110.1 short transient receptor potential channel 4-like isoform X1 [Anneissia japonica]XP_033099111.1 short transient receptor potential channel 4-like isoform X2 [Anneissia japonica]
MNDGDIIDLPVNDRFLKAVKDGEISDIEYILNNKDTNELNINHRDKKGRNALVIAVNNGTLLIIKTLLKHGINVGDSLLRAVESQFFEAVVLICNHTKSHPEDREAIIECHTENDDFHPDITPIILASHHNNYKIIKVLLKYGSTIPDPDTSDFLRTEKHTLQRSVGTLNIYRALASEAYISLTSTDPIGTAFSMCDRLRSLSNQEYEFRAEYNELAEQMEQYAADILGQARSSEESSTVLTHQEDKLYDVIDQGLDHCQLYKVFEAINVEQKKFVAHPHCQQLLIKRFYGQFSSVRDWGTISQLGFSLTVMVLFPILSIIYLFCPTRRLKFTIRTPYIKFLMDVGSKMYFLSFVLMTTAVSKPITEVDADLDDQNFSQLPNWLLGIILAFVLGLTWHELKQVYVSGWQRFKNDGQNFMDFVLLVLYWSYLMLTLMSYLDLRQQIEVNNAEIQDLQVRDLTVDQLDEYLTNITVPDLKQYISSSLSNTELSINAHTKEQLTRVLTELMNNLSCNVPVDTSPSVITADSVSYYRLSLDPFHPALVAEGLYACATIIAFLRLLNLSVASPLVGPLQISLGGMLLDIVKFILVFAIIWFAFALGLNQVYQYYEDVRHQACIAENGEENCRVGPFFDIWQSLLTLFWTLFGLQGVTIVQLNDADHAFTESIGTLLFAFYLLFAVVVLLNALIAMMSNTYTRVEENSDTEWKFARAKMWGRFLQLRDTVPPPFNVIPSVKWMRVFWHNLRFEWCITRAAYRRRNQSKHRDVQSAEQQYLLIIKQLVTRYITEKTTTTGDTEAGVSRADVINIKNDLAVFRYETFKMLTNQEKAFVSLNTRYNEIREQLQKVDDVYNKTTDLDTNVQELRDRTLEIRETVDDMTMSLLPGSSRRSTSNL